MIPTVQTCPPGAASFFWVCSVTRCHFCILCLSILIYWLINCYNNQFMLPCWFEVVSDKFQHYQKTWIESQEFFVGTKWDHRDLSESLGLGGFSATCGWGFYCLGGLEPPRSCNGGEHCPGNTGDEPRTLGSNVLRLEPVKCKDWNLGKPSFLKGAWKKELKWFNYPGRFFPASWGWRGKNWLRMTREWNYTSVFFRLRRNTHRCDPMLLLSSETNPETRLKTSCFVLPCQFFWTLRCLSQKLFLPDPGWQCFFASMTGVVEPQTNQRTISFFFNFIFSMVNSDGFAAI